MNLPDVTAARLLDYQRDRVARGERPHHALSTLALYVACWLGAAALNLPVTHMFIGLFTAAEITSVTALCVGGFWSFIWGGFAGLVTAVMYNLVGFVDRRPASSTREG